MGFQEYALFIGLVIIVPLVIAVVVTLWTLEQARLRSRKNRPPRPSPPAEAVGATPPPEDVSPPNPGQ